MAHRKARIAAGLIGSIAIVVGTAGIGAAQSPAASAPAASGASATCQAVPVGIVTRCENFYTDYWPAVNAKLDSLYQEALATNGGQIVIWDWYELDPAVIQAFTTRFPGLKIKTQGFQQNLSSAIITAQQTGTENSDYLSGSLTSATPLYDAGLFEKIDWQQYGLPAEFFTVGPSELLPDSINSWLINYNTTKVTSVPSTYDDYLAADWKGKLAMAGYNGQFFTGYGMVNGTDKMQKLITDLKATNLTLTDDPDTLLSTGDKPVMFGGQLYNPSPDLAVQPIKDGGVWIQFGGVNSEAKNKAGATLYAIWNAYDPDWITKRLTDTNLSSSVPFPGLPSTMLDQAAGLMKVNADAMYAGAATGQWETTANRDQWNQLIADADTVMYK